MGLVCLDRQILARPDLGVARFAFYLETLEALREDLRAQGGDLLVVDEPPAEFFGERLGPSALQPALVTFNRDYEPFARERDALISSLLKARGIPCHTERDHLILEPAEVEKPAGGGYQVFTPFAKRWSEVLRSSIARVRAEASPRALRLSLQWRDLGARLPADALAARRQELRGRIGIPLPRAGHRAAVARLDEFIDECLASYATARDLPAVAGTSGLSIYLKNGSLSSAQVFARVTQKFPTPGSAAAQKFRQEIVWREFYYHLLWRRPEIETTAFQTKYAAIPWSGRDEWFAAWTEGRTGFPIVDAGMRQLRATGWMHNRVRMITASFLTKDLHLDWRRGERHFMRELLDGDLAPNNGGWQWAASTGADAQPYFRVFNPALQAKRFDPDSTYIRRWVPEVGTDAYPPPIVDHAAQARRAIQMYAEASPRG